MKIFILKLSVAFCVFVLSDFLVAQLLSKTRPVDYGAFVNSRIQYLKSENNYDLILIGDSHLADAFNTKIIEDSCGIRAFNLGIYHATPFDNYYFLKKVLSIGKTPKKIILGTNPDMFYKKAIPSKYLYSIIDDRIINIEMNFNSEGGFDAYSLLKSGNEKYLIPRIWKNMIGEKYEPTREVTTVYNGFLEFKNQTQTTEWINFKEKNKKVNAEQIKYLCRIIELAHSKNIEVIIANPPIWKTKLEHDQTTKYFEHFNKVIDEVCNKYKIKMYNKSNEELNAILLKRDFLNADHLNYYGATKTTNNFVSWFNYNFNKCN